MSPAALCMCLFCVLVKVRIFVALWLGLSGEHVAIHSAVILC